MSNKTPAYRLTIDGKDISPKVNGRLINLSITDERGGKADQLDIGLSDHDGKLAIPPRGAVAKVWIGYQEDGGLTYKGEFTIDEVSHSGTPDVLTLRGRSVDFRGSLKQKREQSWHNLALGDVVQTIAKRNGLDASVSDKLNSVLVQHMDQTKESDINFMTRLGKLHDAIATVKNGKLILVPAGAGNTANGQSIPPMTLTRQGGDQHRYEQADRNTYTGVIAYWNQTTEGQRKEELAGNNETPKVLRKSYANQAEAQTAAQSEWKKLQRKGSTFSLTLAEGKPNLFPETPITAIGWKPKIDNTPWIVARVVHNLSDGGYTCRVEMEAKV